MEKQNCWDFFTKCTNLDCEARHDNTLDGVHGGKNGGRSCWTVAGTMCIRRTVARNHNGGDYGLIRDGRMEVRDAKLSTGIHAKELQNCRECSFYKQVKEEEGKGFLAAISIFEQFKDNEQNSPTV